MPADVPRPRHRWAAAIYARLPTKTLDAHRRFAAGGARGRVIELGAGTGDNLAFYAWDQVDSLDLTEPDPYMLAYARRKLAKLPADVQAKVRVHEVPAERLPFDDASFDTAVVTVVLCSVFDPAGSLAELRRVLKPGGEARLVEHVRGNGFLGRMQALLQPVYGWFAAGCHLTRRTEAAVRAAGFDLEVSERFSLGPLWPAFAGVARRPFED